MNTLYCLTCGKELKGRSDKKFCDTQCRSSFHNTNRAPHEVTIQNINSALRRNRSLMAHFCPSGKSTVDKYVLIKLGFKFDLFTHIFPFSSGTYFFCYDYGFLPIKDKGTEKMVIVQKQSYMENLNFHPWDFNIVKDK
ncbi:hypothetical protein [Changchengzhania lutea]|uniref:hypothetical protein n=1 Tax=Changchengzhania lutea TaxID=2049305 RepID=UPI00115C9AA2|nr:hypothetical protein [Changchengzhania lutea]